MEPFSVDLLVLDREVTSEVPMTDLTTATALEMFGEVKQYSI